MDITKWNPFLDSRHLRESILDHFSLNRRISEMFDVDVWEDEASINIKAELPGFKKENISIELEDTSVVITAKESNEKVDEDPSKRYYKKEITSQSFTRRIGIPSEINMDTAEAKYENGHLTIRLTKIEPPKAPIKKIEVK